jgi:murein DD-endopeptidase MepM/ murein hydrolase activator NlpD
MAVAVASGPLDQGLSEPVGDENGPIHSARFLLSGHNVFHESYRPKGIDGVFGQDTAAACIRAKQALGYPKKACLPTFGATLRAYLLGEQPLPPAYRRRRLERAGGGPFGYPAAIHARVIGRPFQGTHDGVHGPDNWESMNAWDLAFPFGTPLIAVADGVIGSQIGALSRSAPQLQGLRCHLKTDGNEFYYAHLSRLAVVAGQRVRKGDPIGLSGAANGANHLHLAVRRLEAYRAIAES